MFIADDILIHLEKFKNRTQLARADMEVFR